MESTSVDIIGAGPAGLVAALAVARAGGRAVVHERHQRPGERFHGDFQGLENWTTGRDALDDLRAMGVEPTFDAHAFRECVWFDTRGREIVCRSQRPFFYVVRRGDVEGSVDRALEAQARAAGVEIRNGAAVTRLPRGGIVATGPRRADAIAVGYVFETTMSDGCWSAFGDRFAPGGYAYLIVSHGRGTVATCLFRNYHEEATYLERTLELFETLAGLTMRAPRRFGGLVNFQPGRALRKGSMLYVGEAAGLQDALFGFGMRIAMTSGHLAARAILKGRPSSYEKLLDDRLGKVLRAGFVNRYLFDRMGDAGYDRLLGRVARAKHQWRWVHRFNRGTWIAPGLYPLARRRLATEARRAECDESCHCTWCRCTRHGEEAAPC